MSLASPGEHQDSLTSLIDHHLTKDMLRFTTAGSVDDGKSTLIGRLLHDSKSVYEDQMASVRNSRVNRSGGPIDFSLLTDGLRAEREQGITIDVAYRYFETPLRKFIIADTPGHEQYTRNMATGASTADLAVILIDSTRGVLAQTRRHAYIASLLGIPNVVGAINKMDLQDYREDVFRSLQEEFSALAAQLHFSGVVCIPISSLAGDNLVTRTSKMPWYGGPTLLEHLETVPIRRAVRSEPLRFPVQYVIRPDASFRGFAGQVASGLIREGDPVLALPSRQETRVRSIVTGGAETEAFAPMSVTLTLEDEIDLSRGDMLVSPGRLPHVSRHFDAMVVWFDAQPLVVGRTYLLKHAVRGTRAKATAIEFRVEMGALERQPAHELKMNDIAAVQFEAASPLFFDAYERNRTTGSFILIDVISNATVGAGMIRQELEVSASAGLPAQVGNESLRQTPVSNQERYSRHGHLPALVLLQDQPEMARELERALFQSGFEVALLSQEDLPADRLPGGLALAEAAGLILVYSAGPLKDDEKRALRALSSIGYFDVTAMELPADKREAVSAIALALGSLRISAEGPDAPDTSERNDSSERN